MSNVDKWESGELGRDAEHVAVAPGSKQAVDDVIGMQPVSIRLQKQLLCDLKRIAEYHGIGYQPMIRDLLNRFAQSEIKKILLERINEIEEQSKSVSESSTAPVREFLEKQRA